MDIVIFGIGCFGSMEAIKLTCENTKLNKRLSWSIIFERKSQGKGKVEVVLYSRYGICNPLSNSRAVLEILI